MNPIATIYMANGAKIVIELLPEAAPNTVNSFIYAASHHVFDGHVIERIVPGNWIDMSFTGFKKKEGQYLIPYEYKLHPEIEPLPTLPGYVGMGGYPMAQAGCEFFFPLRECPEHKGVYPVFGKVLEGMEEIYRLEKVETVPVENFPYDVVVNTPVKPQIITRVELDLHGETYPEPVRFPTPPNPTCWDYYWEGKFFQS
ncbi:MAG: peptidylprolyl isomerase [Clostridiales bacterium]|nr:peptidylprolyl isomerase [Clostridiales bacterium]